MVIYLIFCLSSNFSIKSISFTKDAIIEMLEVSKSHFYNNVEIHVIIEVDYLINSRRIE